MMKKICFIAQFPPPIHGLSKAVDTLYNSSLNEKYRFEKINVTDNKKFIYNLIKIIKSDADLFYLTISQTKLGNLRDLIILKFLFFLKRKCLVHLHGGYYRQLVDNDLPNWQRKMNYKIIKKMAGVIVLGPSLKKIFTGMIDEKKIFVVPNGVDNKYLLKEKDFQNKLEIKEKKKIKTVVYLSNFIKEKGYPKVLELAKMEQENIVKGSEQRFRFVFAGSFFDEKDEEEFFGFLSDNNLGNIVEYYGVVDGARKYSLLEDGDIFILLTNYKKEGQPISILEAMAAGMKIISTNFAGIPDILDKNILFDYNDISLDDIWNYLNENEDLNQIKENRNNVLNQYMEVNYIKGMTAVFNHTFRKE